MKTLITTFTACALSIALGMPVFAESPASTPVPTPASVQPVKADAPQTVPAKSVKKHRKHVKTTPSAPTTPAPAMH